MRIAVTGGSGKLGRHVVRRLRASGHDVLNLDATGERWTGWTQVYLTDHGQVATSSAARTVSSIRSRRSCTSRRPALGLAPDAATFRNNMTVTFNVLHAAIRQGITRIVMASSETVLGLPFDTPPPYGSSSPRPTP